jgi:hypothetical protein
MFSCKVLVGPIATDKEYHAGETICLELSDANTLAGLGIVEIGEEVKPKLVAQVTPAPVPAPAVEPTPVAEIPAPAVEPTPVIEIPAPAVEPTPVAEIPAPAAESTPVIEVPAPAVEPTPVIEIPAPVAEPTTTIELTPEELAEFEASPLGQQSDVAEKIKGKVKK